jgi:hypothetical protein
MTDTATSTETPAPANPGTPTVTPEHVLPRDLPSDFREAAKIATTAADVVGAVDPSVAPFLDRLGNIWSDLDALAKRLASFAKDLEAHATGKTAPVLSPMTVAAVQPATPVASSSEPTPTTLSPGDAAALKASLGQTAAPAESETPPPPAGFRASTGAATV